MLLKSVTAIAKKTAGNVETLQELNEQIRLLSESILAPFAKEQDSASEALRVRVDQLVRCVTGSDK